MVEGVIDNGRGSEGHVPVLFLPGDSGPGGAFGSLQSLTAVLGSEKFTCLVSVMAVCMRSVCISLSVVVRTLGRGLGKDGDVCTRGSGGPPGLLVVRTGSFTEMSGRSLELGELADPVLMRALLLCMEMAAPVLVAAAVYASELIVLYRGTMIQSDGSRGDSSDACILMLSTLRSLLKLIFSVPAQLIDVSYGLAPGMFVIFLEVARVCCGLGCMAECDEFLSALSRAAQCCIPKPLRFPWEQVSPGESFVVALESPLRIAGGVCSTLLQTTQLILGLFETGAPDWGEQERVLQLSCLFDFGRRACMCVSLTAERDPASTEQAVESVRRLVAFCCSRNSEWYSSRMRENSAVSMSILQLLTSCLSWKKSVHHDAIIAGVQEMLGIVSRGACNGSPGTSDPLALRAAAQTSPTLLGLPDRQSYAAAVSAFDITVRGIVLEHRAIIVRICMHIVSCAMSAYDPSFKLSCQVLTELANHLPQAERVELYLPCVQYACNHLVPPSRGGVLSEEDQGLWKEEVVTSIMRHVADEAVLDCLQVRLLLGRLAAQGFNSRQVP